MATEPFSEHVDQALRGQWRLPEMPWDEPVKFSGSSRRERLLCKFDLLDTCDALYHFKLGGRARMGQLHVLAWNGDNELIECLEWLDTDELRHLRALRRLTTTLRKAGREEAENEQRTRPDQMWNVGKCPRGGPAHIEALALRTLIDEAVTRTLFRKVSRGNHIPLVRAVYSVCARDDARHEELLTRVLTPRLAAANPVRVVALQSMVLGHIARLQNAFRPYFRSFAGATGSTSERVASEMFRSISKAVGELGPAWKRYPTARMVHAADRSPWMLWLLR